MAEAIVNAVAHRDYCSNGSVQVMLFADRLEITNPGHLAPELSIEKLKQEHGSYPPNKLLAEVLYQAGYIERYGTGTGEIFRLLKKAGLQEPVFSLDEGFKVIIWRPMDATDSKIQAGVELGVESNMQDMILTFLYSSNHSKKELAVKLGKAKPTRYLNDLVKKMLALDLIEYTIPEKPNSRLQKYRLTIKGKVLKKTLGGKSTK